jgi:hypothetical protein
VRPCLPEGQAEADAARLPETRAPDSSRTGASASSPWACLPEKAGPTGGARLGATVLN